MSIILQLILLKQDAEEVKDIHAVMKSACNCI